jgi:predicted ATPase
VVIAEPTRRLLGASFELEDLGEHDLKGIARPVDAFAVTGERSVESRFEARSGLALLPMVGRDQELALLLERWTRAKAGEGQGVLLVGEAGIGKSRISRALLDAVANEPHTRVRYQCSPYHTDSPLWPVVQQLGRDARLEADDSPDEALDKVEELIGVAADDVHATAALIAPLLGLDGERRYGRIGLTPQAQRARALEALIAQLMGLARQQPVLVVLEDAHWVDATTLELMELCLDRITDARALILLTSRPDNQPALAARPHVTQLTLTRLGRAGVEAIVASLRGDTPMPPGLIDAIAARTDGVPLFVEELTKAVLETGETGVPATLHDALVARLDRLPEVKEVAQVGACIGREFDHRLLSAVADKPEDELIAALDKLARAELVFRRGTPLEATYSFKHALVRDVAYHSMLKSRRQQLHGEIAEAIRRHFPESAGRAPE